MKSLVFLFVAICFSFLEVAAQSQAVPAPQRNDSITIHIKFTSPCVSPGKIKIWRYDVWEVMMSGDEVSLNNGEVSYRAAINSPQMFVIRLAKTKFNVLTTPLEKNYEVEFTCLSGSQKMKVRDSYENDAFSQLCDVNKDLSDTLEKVSDSNLTDMERFKVDRNLLLDYQSKAQVIAKKYSHSFTAHVLCMPEIMPDSVLSSYELLRDNYLQRQVFADRFYYNCNFLVTGVFHNYLYLLNKSDTVFTGLKKALEIASNNPEAAKLLQNVFYTSLYNRHKEALLQGFINWTKANPDKMVNPQVKYMLSSLEKAMPGAPYIDLDLKDPAGVERKLGQTVTSAKLTLLIFYSPTCSHCQETLPKIVPLWNQYKGKGLKIYAAGFDGTNDEWSNFIKTKGTGEWTNVFDTEYGHESSGKYSATSTPTMFLIDGQGKIITRFADLEYLQSEIPKLLGE